MLSHFSRVQLYATPRTAAHQAPPSTELSRQEHWSGLPFPAPTSLLLQSNFYTHTQRVGEREKIKATWQNFKQRSPSCFFFLKTKLPCRNPLREHCPLRPERSKQQVQGATEWRHHLLQSAALSWEATSLLLFPTSFVAFTFHFIGRKESKGWEDHEPGNNNNLKITTQPLKPPH